jgi:DNA-binding NtrC family response regulator
MAHLDAAQSLPDGTIQRVVRNSPNLRVLVVDDESLIRWSIGETLDDAGHLVVEAADGAAAIRTIATGERFDVVLLDYRLPDSNDLALLTTIKRLAPETAVIMMTAFGAPEVIRGALALGAHCVLSKPFEVHEIVALVLEAHAAPLGRTRLP